MHLPLSIIVTTYNRPDALAMTLRGLAEQQEGGFEVLVADDGSSEDTAEMIQEIAANYPAPLQHIWHADQGFRAAAIRNRAIAASSGEYVVLMDGDCIPRPCFTKCHRKLAQKGWIVGGTRLLLSEEFTQTVLDENLPVHRWGRTRWIKPRLQGRTNRVLPMLLPLPDGNWRRRRPQSWKSLRTFNMCVHRSALLDVNGLDESIAGWGSEDSDLVIRLLHAGIRIKSGRHASPVLHLWHPPLSRDSAKENQDGLQEVLQSHRIKARQGLIEAAEAARH